MSQPSLTLSLASDPVLDAERRRGLRQMRLVALSLLVFAAVVFLATLRVKDEGFWGFVNAGAEASMVGAMADWFAVTALFRHPLGIPIPHTALIPRRKDMLASELAGLHGRELPARGHHPRPGLVGPDQRRLAQLALEPANARRVVDEALARHDPGSGADARRGGSPRSSRRRSIPRLREEPISPIAGSLLGEVVRDKAHYGWWTWRRRVPPLADREPRDVRAGLSGARAVAGAAPGQRPRHHAGCTRRPSSGSRRSATTRPTRPGSPSTTCSPTSPTTCSTTRRRIERAERLKVRILDHPQLMETVLSRWRAFRSALIAALADPEGSAADADPVEVEEVRPAGSSASGDLRAPAGRLRRGPRGVRREPVRHR